MDQATELPWQETQRKRREEWQRLRYLPLDDLMRELEACGICDMLLDEVERRINKR